MACRGQGRGRQQQAPWLAAARAVPPANCATERVGDRPQLGAGRPAGLRCCFAPSDTAEKCRMPRAFCTPQSWPAPSRRAAPARWCGRRRLARRRRQWCQPKSGVSFPAAACSCPQTGPAEQGTGGAVAGNPEVRGTFRAHAPALALPAQRTARRPAGGRGAPRPISGAPWPPWPAVGASTGRSCIHHKWLCGTRIWRSRALMH